MLNGWLASVRARDSFKEHHAALHDAPRNSDTPGDSVRVMDCTGKAQRRRRFRPHARAASACTPSPARKRRGTALMKPGPDRGCVADQPQQLRRNNRLGNTQHALGARRAAADPASSGTQPQSMMLRAIATPRRNYGEQARSFRTAQN